MRTKAAWRDLWAALLLCMGLTPIFGQALVEPTVPAVHSNAARTRDWADDSAAQGYLLLLDNPIHSQVVQAGSWGALGYRQRRAYAVHPEVQAIAAALVNEYKLVVLDAWPMDPLRVHCLAVRFSDATTAQDTLALLQRDPRIQHLQPLQDFAVQAGLPLGSLMAPGALMDDRLDVGSAHLRARGEGVRVAVVDTGMDLSHPALADAVLEARNFVDQDDAQFRRDQHGTQVAGLLSARPRSDLRVVGLAPAAGLLAYKACWVRSPTSEGRAHCNTLTLAKALVAALDARADVLNLSLSGPSDPLLERLVTVALARGVAVLGAVPPDGRKSGFPLSVPGVMAVDRTETARALVQGELRAPGEDVMTLKPGGGGGFASGSSMATAQASAVVALLRSVRPKASVAQLAQWMAAASPRGVLNACLALRLAGEPVVCRGDVGALTKP
jgi:hypothetical protein